MLEMEFLIAITIYLVLAGVWLNVLATLAVNHDRTLEPFQKYAQLAIVWLVPLIGSGFVLHLVFDHSPGAIPKFWIPWPFETLIFGKKFTPNRNRYDRELDVYPSRRRHEDSGMSDSIDVDGGEGGD